MVGTTYIEGVMKRMLMTVMTVAVAMTFSALLSPPVKRRMKRKVASSLRWSTRKRRKTREARPTSPKSFCEIVC